MDYNSPSAISSLVLRGGSEKGEETEHG